MSARVPAPLATLATFTAQFPEFHASSWQAWRSIGAAILGETPEDGDLVRSVTGRTQLPTSPVDECFAIVGRGGGKSRYVGGLLSVYFACAFEHHPVPGEQIYICVYAPTQRQAGITFRYIVGLIKSVPTFAAMVLRETADTVELSNGIVIEVGASNYRTVRGRSIVLAVVEEGAFLPTDDSATPDSELLRSLRPALARVTGSLLLFVSSPYAKRGELYRAFRDHYGKDGDDTLVVRASTRQLNPMFSQRAIDKAQADDPVSAETEYGAAFRSDVESFVSREAVDAVVVPGRLELPPVSGVEYTAFADFAGGGGQDSATLAIAHKSGLRQVLDAIREVRPPFSPEEVCRDFAEVCRGYRVRTVIADHWGGKFPVEGMRKHGIAVTFSERTKSEIYRECLALLNSGLVELLDVPRLVTQLTGLERRVGRGGRDSIDHEPGAHDDLANAACGALVKVSPIGVQPAHTIPVTGFAGGDGSARRHRPEDSYSDSNDPDYEPDPVTRDWKRDHPDWRATHPFLARQPLNQVIR